MKKHGKKLFPALLIPFMALNILAILNPGNRCATSPQHADEQLRTRIYAASPDTVSKTVHKLAPQQKTYGRQWRIREITQEENSLTIWCEVPVLFFTDDLRVTIKPGFNASTQVNIVSQSRVGRSDLGENRRHVLQLLAALDNNLLKSGAAS